MNYNYPGSVSEHNVNFASTVDVIVDEKNELFNAISIYIPASLATGNIVDWDPAWATPDKPAVFTCVVNNYKEYMKGKLLNQFQPIFLQDTNVSVILYLIIFADDQSTSDMWDIDDVSIQFKPITDAFNKLYFISYLKVMFDETYDGTPIALPPTVGTVAAAQINVANPTSVDISLPAGTYTFNDGNKGWSVLIQDDVNILLNDSVNVNAFADTVGSNALLAAGTLDTSIISPAFPQYLTATVLAVAQGTDPTSGLTQPSKYHDYALALSYMCKQDIKLSYCINMIKTSFIGQQPNPNDAYWTRLKTSAEEKEAMTSIATGDRAKHFWGVLFLMGCVKNIWTVIHSEPVNIVVLALAEWFAAGRNSSEQFVGNKLAFVRLSGTQIKPFGFPSWLNSEVNENDVKAIPILQAKQIGFLRTISDNTPQESVMDSARSIDGTPVSALMISRWVDYTSSQQVAKFLTDKGTATEPVLNNEAAYNRIQEMLFRNLLLFSNGMQRLTNIVLTFPPFPAARVDIRSLVATSSWKATYVDDLNNVTVTGGLVVS